MLIFCEFKKSKLHNQDDYAERPWTDLQRLTCLNHSV